MQPKQILPGQVIMSTRRTLGRQMFFTPNRRISEAFGYFLAIAANETRTGIWGGVLLGNHPHLGVIDSGGPELATPGYRREIRARLNEGDQRAGTRDVFFEKLHASFATWINEVHDRSGMVFDEKRVHELILLDEDAVIQRMVYMLLNPQRAGIVRHHWEYGGFIIKPRDWGRTLTFKRPEELDGSKVWPEVAELHVQRPPVRYDLSTDELREWVLTRTKVEAKYVDDERRSQGKPGYTGMRAARRRRPTSVPKSPDQRKKGARVPKFASRNEKLIEKAKKALGSYQAAYSVALLRLRDGSPATFPAGATLVPWLSCSARDRIKPGEPSILPQPP